MCPIKDNSKELDQNSKALLGQHGDQNGGNHAKPEKGNQQARTRNNGNNGKSPLEIGHGGQPGTRNK